MSKYSMGIIIGRVPSERGYTEQFQGGRSILFKATHRKGNNHNWILIKLNEI